MSEIKSTRVPSWLGTRGGESISPSRCARLATTKKVLAANVTPAEHKFRKFMAGFTGSRRPNPLWFTFQKQFNITAEFSFFVDFYFKESKLVVEIDGKHHKTNRSVREWDGWRTKLIADQKLTVLRFDNDEVLTNMPGVARQVIEWVLTHSGSRGQLSRLRTQLGEIQQRRPDFFALTFPDGIPAIR